MGQRKKKGRHKPPYSGYKVLKDIRTAQTVGWFKNRHPLRNVAQEEERLIAVTSDVQLISFRLPDWWRQSCTYLDRSKKPRSPSELIWQQVTPD
jgi:hypothetical protein